jgi:hypothetical protein
LLILHTIEGNRFGISQTISSRLLFSENNGELSNSQNNEVLLLNVGGELIYATRNTLTYITHTVLSSIIVLTNENRSKLVQYDENGRIFLDFSPILFKHALEELRRWKNRDNISTDQELVPPSWRVQNEFDEMLISLGLAKYRQSKKY